MEYFINQSFRLTPAQFKAVIKGKGWTIQKVADRWGISRTWLSQIINDPSRPPHFDDSVMALPYLPNIIRDLKRRQDTANHYLSLSRVKVIRPTSRIIVEEIGPGSIINVSEDIGSIAEAHMRGYVFAVRGPIQNQEYGIIFPTGMFDWFPESYLKGPLAESGISDPNPYEFLSEDLLIKDFKDGRFKFVYDFESDRNIY